MQRRECRTKFEKAAPPFSYICPLSHPQAGVISQVLKKYKTLSVYLSTIIESNDNLIEDIDSICYSQLTNALPMGPSLLIKKYETTQGVYLDTPSDIKNIQGAALSVRANGGHLS